MVGGGSTWHIDTSTISGSSLRFTNFTTVEIWPWAWKKNSFWRCVGVCGWDSLQLTINKDLREICGKGATRFQERCRTRGQEFRSQENVKHYSVSQCQQVRGEAGMEKNKKKNVFLKASTIRIAFFLFPSFIQPNLIIVAKYLDQGIRSRCDKPKFYRTLKCPSKISECHRAKK